MTRPLIDVSSEFNQSQYKSDIIQEFPVRLKSVITRTHYRWKDACEKQVYRLKYVSLRPGLLSMYLDYKLLSSQMM